MVGALRQTCSMFGETPDGIGVLMRKLEGTMALYVPHLSVYVWYTSLPA